MKAKRSVRDYVIQEPPVEISERELAAIKSQLVAAVLRERNIESAVNQDTTVNYSKSGGYIKTAYSKGSYSRSAYIRG